MTISAFFVEFWLRIQPTYDDRVLFNMSATDRPSIHFDGRVLINMCTKTCRPRPTRTTTKSICTQTWPADHDRNLLCSAAVHPMLFSSALIQPTDHVFSRVLYFSTLCPSTQVPSTQVRASIGPTLQSLCTYRSAWVPGHHSEGLRITTRRVTSAGLPLCTQHTQLSCSVAPTLAPIRPTDHGRPYRRGPLPA